MYLPKEIHDLAAQMRQDGHSLKEISALLGIAKSTASYWSKDIILGEKAQIRIEDRRVQGRINAGLANRRLNAIRRERKWTQAQLKVLQEFQKVELNPSHSKLICALLYWAEGGKESGQLDFVNSDPRMIKTFLHFFRKGYATEESKFRVLVHIHDYHDDQEIKMYWSQVTDIPLTQFTKSYRKPHTGHNTHPGYKGCIRVSYHNSQIALELQALYNIFAQAYGCSEAVSQISPKDLSGVQIPAPVPIWYNSPHA